MCLKSQPCAFGAASARGGLYFVRKLPLRGGWLGGHRWDRHLGGCACHTTQVWEPVAAGKKGLIGATRKQDVSLTASLGGLVSELILNAKREMGAAWWAGWRGEGRTQILSGLLAVIGAVQSRCFKAFGGIILHSGRGGYTHKVGMHYSGGIACSAPLVRTFATSVPPSPKAHC